MNILSAARMFSLAEEKYGSTSNIEEELKKITFENMTINAARSGDTQLVTTTPPASADILRKQGFCVRELVRKELLLNSLENTIENSERLATIAADKFIFNNKDFKINRSDGLSHRNKLVSIIKTLWNEGLLKENSSIYHFEELLKSISNISNDAILHNRFLLKSILDYSKSMQMAMIEAELIKVDHNLLPPKSDYGVLVDWSEVDSSNLLNEFFSPKLLKWYSLNWEKLAHWINESISNIARQGSFALHLTVSKDSTEFKIHDPDFSDDLLIKTVPWKSLFRHLSSLGYTINASVIRFDTIYHDKEVEEYIIDPFSDFNLTEYDLLGLTIYWIGVEHILSRQSLTGR